MYVCHWGPFQELLFPYISRSLWFYFSQLLSSCATAAGDHNQGDTWGEESEHDAAISTPAPCLAPSLYYKNITLPGTALTV